nr:hypothetical protein [Tanacetum cinerariifolium]
MATFVSSYISDLSPVKDNIKLPVCILRAWLQPLYNKQQVKNIEMIAMYEHESRKKPVTFIDDEGSEIKCTLWGDYAKQFNDFLNSCDDHERIVLVLQFAIMKFWDGKMCIQNGYWGTKLYLFDGNKAIYEDEYKEVDGIQSVIVGTVIAIQEDEGWWYLGCKACRGKDETWTMSLSLFNDEVRAMKTNKRPAEGERGSESSTGKKKAVEIKVEKDA